MQLPPAPELETPRLRLAPFGNDESAAILAVAGDARFFRYLEEVPDSVKQGYGPADAADHLQELLDLRSWGFPHWAMRRKTDGLVVGTIRFRPGERYPELGYGVAPAHWGSGYAGEAVRAVLAWCRAVGVAVEARCHPQNAASRKILADAGFEEAGTDALHRIYLVWDPLVSPTPS